MKFFVMALIFGSIAFALGVIWYFAFDVYATRGAHEASDWVIGAVFVTAIIALFGGFAISEMD